MLRTSWHEGEIKLMLSLGCHEYRRVTLVEDWVVAPESRQLVPGRVAECETLPVENSWLVEPAGKFQGNHPLMMGRTLCNDYQVHKTIPVEVYNPGSEPVTLRRDTWLGVMSPSQMVPGVQPLETVGEVEKPVAVR